MITSGHLFDKINEKIAILRTEITQSGKRGVLNIHKQCENLVKHLLNQTYGYELVNLNVPITNFPSLDLGDETIGIAYQVSSDKRAVKLMTPSKKCCDLSTMSNSANQDFYFRK